tara:strand:- start:8580 stop:8978 length:399 start_codon:yes stop_codon:yes gene_type:complete
MGLVIEISIDIKKNNRISEIKSFLSDLAEEYNSESDYFIYETEGTNSRIERNDCIHVVEFNTPQIEFEKKNILNFIKKIISKNLTKLDTIYQDNGKINMIYNSLKQKNYNKTNDRSKKNKPIIDIIKKNLDY